MSTFTIFDVREVDDAGGTHLESVMTSGFIVEAWKEGKITFENNIRPDWQPGAKAKPKTKRKVARWAEEILKGTAILGNLSVRLDPATPHELVRDPETGLDLVIEVPDGESALDTAVDSQSRLEAKVLAAQSQPALFNSDQRNAVRIYIATKEKAREMGSEYNTRGDKVNDSAAKYAHAAQPLEKVASWLVKKSGNPHLSTDNVEVLSNTVSATSHKLCGYNTVVKAIEQEWTDKPITDQQVERMGRYISDCWEHLVSVRPEYGLSSIRDRRRYRDESVAGSALALYGALALINACYEKGLTPEDAKPYLNHLAPDSSGDWLAKTTPIWQSIGVLAPAKLDDGTEVLRPRNTFQSRSAIAKAFRDRAGI